MSPHERPDIRLDDFDFELPEGRIAQQPSTQRDASKLLVIDRATSAGSVHAKFRDLPQWLEAGDLLVVNTTRVENARLRGRRESGGRVEALLLARLSSPGGTRFHALVKLSGRPRPGIRMHFGPEASALAAEIVQCRDDGTVVLGFEPGMDPYSVGEPPLPPYIHRTREGPDDRERYQTIYARVPGAVAAPTAGLHFSQTLFSELEAKGIQRAEVVLHVGPGTFRPLDDHALETGRLHSEQFELKQSTAETIARTRDRGGRVVAVGTTSARVLEARAAGDGRVSPGRGETDLFLRPGSKLSVVDALITNFHLPRSSLLLLVAAFAGRDRILAAYRDAVAHDYRFYSYGDAMLIL